MSIKTSNDLLAGGTVKPTVPDPDLGLPEVSSTGKNLMSPNPTLDSNTFVETPVIASGTQTPKAAAGTTVESIFPEDWQTPQYAKDATAMADAMFKQNVVEAQQAQLQSRQNIEKNANAANTDYTMLSYQQNQNIDKMGWSGGSYIDAKNQQEYLKASIQADLFGQLELQKYGYETELAKARAAYEANQQQLAAQYMETAYNRAFQVAQQTGTWIDPTIADQLRQWDIANKILDGGENYTDDEKAQALKVREEMLTSFGANGLSEQGVDVLRQILEEQGLYSEDTYSAAQLAALKLETENAAELAEREITKQDEANYIYSYVDTTGATIKVNIFSTLETDKPKILELFTQRPDLFAKGMNTFSDKVMAEYTLWKAQPGNTEKNIAAFISANPGVYEQQFEMARNWAKNLDKESFVFYDRSGKRVNYSTEATVPTTIEGGDEVTDAEQEQLESDPESVTSTVTFPFGETQPEYNAITTAYGDFYTKGYGQTKTASDIAKQYAQDVTTWNQLISGEKDITAQELTDLAIRFSSLSGTNDSDSILEKLLEAKYSLPAGSIDIQKVPSLEAGQNYSQLSINRSVMNNLQYERAATMLNKTGKVSLLAEQDSICLSSGAPNYYKFGSGWNTGTYQGTAVAAIVFLKMFND